MLSNIFYFQGLWCTSLNLTSSIPDLIDEASVFGFVGDVDVGQNATFGCLSPFAGIRTVEATCG